MTATNWARSANVLAQWAWKHLVNRTDVWGGYHPLSERGKEYTDRDGKIKKLGKSTTRPAPSHRGKVCLTEHVLRAHFRGAVPEHIAGLHSTSAQNTSRWGGLDIDRHDGGTADPRVNLTTALAWYVRLRDLGIRSLLTDSNGRGGFHLLTVFADPVATERVFAFLRWLVRDYRQYGLTAPAECFPKQAGIDPWRYGNWLRLPGRHHTHDHWSRVWDGVRWLEGAAAIESILSLKTSPPSLIPQEATIVPAATKSRTLTYKVGVGGPAGLIRKYMAKLPHLGAGNGRDDVAYTFAAWLVRDMSLDDESAIAWLEIWDAGNSPPKGRERLKEILKNAHAYGKRPYGSGLGEHHESVIHHVGRMD